MTTFVGTIGRAALSGLLNPNITPDLSEYAEDEWRPYVSDRLVDLFSSVTINIPVSVVPRTFTGILGRSYFSDFYERIHISDTLFELGTIISPQIRVVSLWNAYTEIAATLDSIIGTDSQGIDVSGAATPYEFPILGEQSWTFTILPEGPPEIAASFLFDFSDVDNPSPVVISGTRGVVLYAMPNTPIREKWSWLTDVRVAQDGSEQRIGLREVPRRSLSTDLRFESESELRQQYKTLFSARGRLFIPYFQYATITTAQSDIGTSTVYFDSSYLDIRDGDYVLFVKNGVQVLAQIDTVGALSSTLLDPLTTQIDKKSQVIAVFPSILPNNLSLQRPAVNRVGSLSLTSNASAPRVTHQRPGNTATLESLDGYYILERRPLADGDVSHTFDTGQEILDAQTGLFTVETSWNFTPVETPFAFQVRRIGSDACSGTTGPEEMDYWRLFTDEMKGSLNNFLLSTYRPDLIVEGSVGDGATSLVISGADYADVFWPVKAYRYFEFVTNAGIHRAEVTASSKNLDGNSVVSFTPGLPTGTGWNVVQYVSYLLKQRIVGDEVELEHRSLDTIISFKGRVVNE